MHSSVSVSVRCLLLAGAGLVAAQAGSSKVNCLTQVGPQPVSAIPTVTAGETSTVSLPATTVTTAVTETTTAAALTQTDTTTVEVTTTTTEDVVTDTFTSTSTSTETTTTTTTQTATTTSTVNTVETTTSTSIIAAPSGFVPIVDTQNGYPARKRDSHRRHCHKATLPKPSVYPAPIAGTYSAAQSSPISSSGSYATTVPCSVGEGTLYPTAVECSATTTAQLTSTETQTSSSTITPAPSTTLVTETVTSTSTEIPRASTTLTLTETSTATETDTQTTTVTETATSTSTETITPTSYAACQANNILTKYQGQAIVNVFNRGRGSATVYDYSQADTPEECCVQCIRKDGCTGTIFRAGDAYCLLMYADGRTCASQSSNIAQFVTGSSTDTAFILSNGACGYQQWVAGN